MSREFEQAMGIAKDAKRIAEGAGELAHKAHLAATIGLEKHVQHEKICAERYGEIITVNNKTSADVTSIGDKVDDMIEKSTNKQYHLLLSVIGGLLLVVGSLIGAIYYGN